MPKMLWACGHCAEIFSGADAWEKATQHEQQVCKVLRERNEQDRERIVGVVRSVVQEELAGALAPWSWCQSSRRRELDKAQKRVFRQIKHKQPEAVPRMVIPQRRPRAGDVVDQFGTQMGNEQAL